MGLWEPGNFNVPMQALVELDKKVWQDYRDCDHVAITDIIMMDENHPDNVWAKEHNYPQHFACIEVEYSYSGFRAGYGIRNTIDGEYEASCFYS